MKNQEGYTLVEFLVIAIILVTITSVVAGVIFSTIAGSRSASSASRVTQNGNAALTVMSNIVQSSTRVLEVDGISVNNCVNPSPTPPLTGESITLRRSDGGVSVLSCAGNSVSSNSASLTDEGVLVVQGTCQFACSQESIFETPFIEITFTLEDPTSTSDLQETFETSTSPRNYAY